MRRLIAFDCEGDALAATVDAAAGATGLLIVSGGNEIRCGAHRGMAALAQWLSARRTPVFRYDRRGVGDSEGRNTGTLAGAADLCAAVAAFRAAVPTVSRIVAYGNCDAAAALALHHGVAGIDALVLANPWLGDESDALPPGAAIRARYRRSLSDPAAWRRLLAGSIDLRMALRGMAKIIRAAPPAATSDRIVDALTALRVPATIVLATGDATAIAFAARWRGTIPIVRIATASHSFAHRADKDALQDVILAALAQAQQLVRL